MKALQNCLDLVPVVGLMFMMFMVLLWIRFMVAVSSPSPRRLIMKMMGVETAEIGLQQKNIMCFCLKHYC